MDEPPRRRDAKVNSGQEDKYEKYIFAQMKIRFAQIKDGRKQNCPNGKLSASNIIAFICVHLPFHLWLKILYFYPPR
jgi:hypothetical protein